MCLDRLAYIRWAEMDSRTCVHSLFEFTSLDDVFIPLRNTARVKYTCFDVSTKFLFIGANSGSLYLFLRNPLQYLRVLSNKEGPIVIIRIASHDQYVAFATSKGVVVLLEHNVSNVTRVGRSGTPTLPPRYLHVSREHQGAIITTLTWNDAGTILFIADDSGKVTSVTVNTPSKKTKTLFQESTAMIAQLDSKIVQMDYAHNKLLISTLTSHYLCDTLKEQYSQIGSKPRAGEFGACFYNKSANQMPYIYAARPGSRLWEVDFEGSVQCTHQFKQALAQKAAPIVSVRENFISRKTLPCSAQNSINFPRLLVINKHILLTWLKDTVLLIDPIYKMVLLWTAFSRNIQDIKIHAKKLYIWFDDGKFRSFQLLAVEDGISKLLSHSCWKLSALVCNFYKDTVIMANSRNLLPKHLLETLITHLDKNGEMELMKAMEDLVASFKEPSVVVEKAHTNGGPFNYQIESGIYVVNRPKCDPNGLSPRHESISLGSSPTISRKTDNDVLQSNGRAPHDKMAHNVLENKSYEAATIMQESKSQNISIKSNEPLSKTTGNLTNCQSGMVKSVSKAITKSSSGTDVQHYKEEKHRSSRGIYLDDVYYGYPTIPMPMPYIGGTFWDIDPTYGYSSLVAINPGATLDGLRNSFTSKYNSGKESILGKIGVLEDHLKSLVSDDPPDLLDVPNGKHCTSYQDVYQDLQNEHEETMGTNISPTLKMDLGALINSTKETLLAIHDPSVIASIFERKQFLEGWVNVLISTQELMYCTLNGQSNKVDQQSTSADIQSKMSQSMSDTTVPVDIFMPGLGKTHCSNQPCGPIDDFRRKSWPNATCVSTNKCHESKEPHFTNGSEPHKNICKSSPSKLENLSICEQFIDPLPRKANPLLKFEDFLWLQEMRLLNKNPVTQIKDANDGECILCQPTIFTVDHWGLSLDEHKLVSQLAQICFNAGIFGRIWKYSADFACFKNMTNLEQPGAASDTHDPFKFAAKNIDKENDELILDYARAIFVTHFFHLLDVQEILRDLHREKHSTFKTWSAIFSGIIKSRANVFSEFKPLLAAFSCQPHDFPIVIEQLMSASDSILARDVLYVQQVRPTLASNLFLEYMDAIYECRSPNHEIPRGLFPTLCPTYQDVCMDPIVHVAWLSHLLLDGLQSIPVPINCICGKPRPWSHLLHWKKKDLLLKIIRLNLGNQAACLQLCEKFGFWLGYLNLCHGLNMRREGLAILVQLGDIALFCDHFDIALRPQVIDEWKAVLHLMTKKENRKNCCLFCETAISSHASCETMPKEKCLSFESIAPFILKFCGAETALKLFKEIMKDLNFKLSPSFYRQCILFTVIKQQGNMAFQSLNIDEDTMPYHKNYASPQIRSHLIKEAQKCRLEKPALPAVNRCPFREDFPCHWGINIDLSSLCCTCSLPLALPLASAHEGGIRMFPCGHGFHLQCTANTTCPIC